MIVLFDIDGTVLTFEGDAPGPGRTAMARACVELYGEDLTRGIRFAGGTDRAIARTILERAGRLATGGGAPDEAQVDALFAAYLRALGDELSHRKYQQIGDVAGAVKACVARGARVGLATGNVREGAHLKLASAGLHDVFVLDQGGYGCDHELRAEVVRKAIERCGGAATDPVVVVGDTRHDVEAARAAGAKCVGVAIDDEARAELEAAGADAIVRACDDVLVSAIFSVVGR